MSLISESLYGKYIKERDGAEIFGDEHSFVSYKISGEECFLANMYIKPEFRKSGLCRKLIGELIEISKKENCKFISANIDVRDPNGTSTLMAAINLGFKLVRAEYGVLAIIKGVE